MKSEDIDEKKEAWLVSQVVEYLREKRHDFEWSAWVCREYTNSPYMRIALPIEEPDWTDEAILLEHLFDVEGVLTDGGRGRLDSLLHWSGSDNFTEDLCDEELYRAVDHRASDVLSVAMEIMLHMKEVVCRFRGGFWHYHFLDDDSGDSMMIPVMVRVGYYLGLELSRHPVEGVYLCSLKPLELDAAVDGPPSDPILWLPEETGAGQVP